MERLLEQTKLTKATSEEIEEKEDEKERQAHVAKWYFIGSLVGAGLATFGFIQSSLIYMKSGEWCAPPFRYPEQQGIIKIHSKLALTWLFISVLQPFFIYNKKYKKYHRLVGKLSPIITIPFLLTAQMASKNHSEPVGPFVLFLQNSISIGVASYYSFGLYNKFINNDTDSHKNAMFAAILSSCGPGIFRALRTIRELRSGRLFKMGLDINNYYNYEDYGITVHGENANSVTYRSVQNFYFMAAFIVTGAINQVIIGKANQMNKDIVKIKLFGKQFSVPAWIVPIVPTLFVAAGCYIYLPKFEVDYNIAFKQL